MYKRYYSDKDNRAFNTEEECRDHELSIEAVEHLCIGPKPKEFFQPSYTEEEAVSDYLSDEVKEKLAKRYSMNPDFVDDFFGNIAFSFFIEHRREFKNIYDLTAGIENYIETAKKIDGYIDSQR